MASAKSSPQSGTSQPFDVRNVRTKGFTKVYNGGSEPEFDIVIIHGLQGHALNTWKCQHEIEAAVSGRDSRKILGFPRKVKGGEEARAQACRRSTYWPSDLLPSSFPDAAVWVYGYDSHVTHFFKDPTEHNNIVTLGRNLLQDLAACREDNPERPLLFICHSLGGIVLKEVCLPHIFVVSGYYSTSGDI